MTKFLNRENEGWRCAKDTLFNRMVSDLQVTKQKFKQTQSTRGANREDILTEEKILEYENAAIRDESTGLYNSRFFAHKLIREVKRSKRYKRPFSLMLISIDKLPQLQKLYGHMIDNDVIKAVAGMISTSVRNVDMVARLSSGQFGVILPETDCSRTVIVAQRIGEKLGTWTFSEEFNAPRLTASIAVSSFPTHARDENNLLSTAMQFLEVAQSNGGDQVYYT